MDNRGPWNQNVENPCFSGYIHSRVGTFFFFFWSIFPFIFFIGISKYSSIKRTQPWMKPISSLIEITKTFEVKKKRKEKRHLCDNWLVASAEAYTIDEYSLSMQNLKKKNLNVENEWEFYLLLRSVDTSHTIHQK